MTMMLTKHGWALRMRWDGHRLLSERGVGYVWKKLFQILTQSFLIFRVRGETVNVWEEDSETGEMADADEDDDEREGFPEPIMCVHGNVKYQAFWESQKQNKRKTFPKK